MGGRNLTVRTEWQLAGHEQQRANASEANVVRDRLGLMRQLDAQFLKMFGNDVHGLPPSGFTIFSGRTHCSNCSAVRNPSVSAASRSVRSSRYAFRLICAAFS